MWLWLSTFVDCSLSIGLFVLLRRRFENNLRGIRNMIRVSFQTALLTGVFSLAGAVCAVAWPQSHVTTANMIMAFGEPLSSLYALSLIVTLASRQEHVVVVVGATLAGYHQSALLDGLAGAQPGGDHGRLRPGMLRAHRGRPFVARRALGSDDDDDDDDDEEEEEDEKGQEAGEQGNELAEWPGRDKELDVEMGTEEDDAPADDLEHALRAAAGEVVVGTGGGGGKRRVALARVHVDAGRSPERRANVRVGFA